MFKDLQAGFQVSLLDKSQKVPQYKVGTVANISPARPDTQKQAQIGQMPMPMMFQERVIDLTIECDGSTNTYTVSEMANVAASSVLTIACSAEPIINEVRAMMKTSNDIIGSVELHREVVGKCESILETLNPAYGDSKRQNERIDKIEQNVGQLVDAVQLLAQVVQGNVKSTKKVKDNVE